MKRTTTRKSRQTPAPGAAEKPFSSWLSDISTETAPIEGTLSAALREWHHEYHVEPCGRANPLQAARLAMSMLQALGIELVGGLSPQTDEVAACIEAELLKDRENASLDRRSRAYKQSLERSNHLRTARMYLAGARGVPGWADLDFD